MECGIRDVEYQRDQDQDAKIGGIGVSTTNID